MAETIEIVSRPKQPSQDAVEIVSRPKPQEPTTFTGRVGANWREGSQDAAEGMARLLGRDLSPWERIKGAGQALMGGMEQVGAIPNAASRTVVGAPIQNNMDAAGAPPWLSEMVANTADLGSQIAAGGALKQAPTAIAALPRTAQEIMAALRTAAQKAPGAVNEAATKAGGVARSTINAADDIVKQRLAGAERSAAEKAAAAPPTAEKLYQDAGKLFEEAKTKGGELPEGYFAEKLNKVRETAQGEAQSLDDVLKANDIDLADHPELYKQALDMKRVIDRRAESGGIKSFNDLIKLHRELRPYVRRAAAEATREGDDTGLRAATILRGEVGKFIDDFPDAAGTLGQAKELWKRASKMEDVDDIMTKAARLNDPGYLQREFRNLALDDYAMKGYTPQERALIDKIAGTSNLENIADAVPGRLGRLKNAVTTARGANDRRMKLASELKDLIARGETAQTEAAAAKAAQPSMLDRFSETFMERPGRGLGPARK